MAFRALSTVFLIALAAFLVRPSLLVTFQEKVLASVGAVISTIGATGQGVDRKWEGLGRKLGN
jgi:hypothetical protein